MVKLNLTTIVVNGKTHWGSSKENPTIVNMNYSFVALNQSQEVRE